MKTIFVSRVRNPDLAHLFEIKRAYFKKTAAFTTEGTGPFRWPGIDRNSLREIVSPKTLKSAWRLARNIRKHGFKQVIFDTADPANIYIGAFLFGSGIRRVYTIHDQIPHNGNKIVQAYNALVLNVMANEIIFFSSPQVKSRARLHVFKLGGYAGENIDTRPKVDFPERRIALMFGRIEPYKGYEKLAAVVQKLNMHDAEILVAGRGNPSLLKGLEAHNNIRIINRYIPDDEAASMFGAARVNLIPYSEATQSGVLLHAASFGVPSVAFDVGSISDYLIPQIGICVTAGDTDGFAAAVRHYLELSDTEWAQVQKNCRAAYFANFSSAAYCAQYKELTND